jgi:GNAT superfamily N-acetyltransferase
MATIRRVPDNLVPLRLPTLQYLDHSAFPEDDPIDHDLRYHWWVAWDGREPIGFLCVLPVGAWVRIVRYGVRSRYRGHGLGQRFLRVCEQYARRNARAGVITYTMPNNARSMNALIAAGYRTYKPKEEYVAADVVYWIKRLEKK